MRTTYARPSTILILLALAALTGLRCSDDSGGSPDLAGPHPDGGALDRSVADIKVAPPTNLLITEFMADPQAVYDTNGEWLELYNPTAAAVDLAGWTIKDDASDKHVIKGPLSIGAGKYLVLARNSASNLNGGISGAYQYDGFNLTNSADEIVLLDAGGKEVDRVAYTSAWGINPGYSNALRNLNLDNAAAGSWCPSKDAWSGGAGDRGSPGAANACGTVKPPPDAGIPPDTGGLPYLQHSISFNESLCSYIANGSKKITLRNKHQTTIKVGEWVKLVCSTSKTTFKAQITQVRLTTWGGVTAPEYQADGFSSQQQMITYMAQYFYPGITLADPCTVYYWTGTAPLP